MADTVTGPTILQQNDNRVVIKIVNQSDGTGATTVFGDVSAMDAREDGTAVAHLALLRVWYSCQGGDGGDSYARLDEEDDDGDIPIIGISPSLSSSSKRANESKPSPGEQENQILCNTKCTQVEPSLFFAIAETSPKTVVAPEPSDSFTILMTTLASFSCKISGPCTASAIIPP